MITLRTTVLACAVLNTALWLGVGLSPWPALISWAFACGLEVVALVPPRH